MRIDGDQAVGGHDQRVAVGLRMGGHFGGDIAVGAGAVLDEERLAHRLGQALRQQPRGDVGRAAGRDRHQHLDRPRRILLRRGAAQHTTPATAPAPRTPICRLHSVSPRSPRALPSKCAAGKPSRACDTIALPNSVRPDAQSGRNGMALKVRRVITGHDANGKAIVKIDEVVEQAEGGPARRHGRADLDHRRISGEQRRPGRRRRPARSAPRCPAAPSCASSSSAPACSRATTAPTRSTTPSSCPARSTWRWTAR